MSTKILIIDHSDTDYLKIKSILGGYDVLLASDEKTVSAMLDNHSDIKIILLETGLRGTDGMALIRKLNETDRSHGYRVIVLTHQEDENIEIAALKSGAADYIRKSIQTDVLKERIGMHVNLLDYQQEIEQHQHEMDLTFNMIFEQAPIGIGIAFNAFPSTKEDNPFFSINPVYAEITGRSKEELRTLGWASVTHPDDLEENMEKYNRLKNGEISGYSMDKRFVRPDGTVVWVNMLVSPLVLSGNQSYKHISLVQDITKRKIAEENLKESERSKSVLLSHLPGLAYRCRYGRDWDMEYVSDGCYDLTGYRPESLINSRDLSFNDIIAPEYREILWEEWIDILAKQMPFNFEYEIITVDGKRKWVLEMGQGIYNSQGRTEALEGIILDISERKEIENDLRFHLKHDRWTGLYNQSYLESLLDEDMKTSDGKKALIGINLSYFHSLNMIYGFHYTQELIKKLASTLKAYTSQDTLLFKMYDNQFAFYVRNYNDRNELESFCKEIAGTLETALALEQINAGIGVMEIEPHHRKKVDQLLRSLLIASEKAIDNLDDYSYGFFDSRMEEAIIREDVIKRELLQIAEGIRPERLYLQYQPILDLKTNEITAIEALARLDSDEYGFVSPMEFIAIAEKTKLIIPLGDRIIGMALDFLRRIREEEKRSLSISINISAIQLLRKDFTDNLFSIIKEMDIPPQYITLEITETIFSMNYEEMNSTLGKLMDYGLHIAIDDFGTGYSTLARERELNVNTLKIDKSFIDKLMYLNPEDAITGDIISMAHRLGHNVVAEGVEHEKQRRYLEDNLCDLIQGYLISRPLDESSLCDMLGKEKAVNQTV